MEELTDTERAMLDLERHWWKFAGAKDRRIRDLFDLNSTSYYRILNALIDRPEALAHDPVLVHRLRRLRTARAKQRSALHRGVSLS